MRSPAALKKRAEYSKRYRDERRVEMNAVAREKYRANHEQRLQYFRDRRAEIGDPKGPCPECGGAKSRTAKTCWPCSIGKRRPRKPLPPAISSCPCCHTEMRSVTWHDRDFWRCPTCGLETTTDELRRFAYEEKAA